MKKQIALPLLLTLLFLGLAGTSALAGSATLFTTMPPETPSPVGFGPLGPTIPTNPVASVSWNCASVGGCNVTDFHYSEFAEQPNTSPNPFLMDIVLLSAQPYDFVNPFVPAFSAPVVPGNVSGLGCFSIAVTTWCNQSIDFASAGIPFVHVPQGTSWITIYGESINNGGNNFWSSSGLLNQISSTLSLDPQTGQITQFPSQLAFTVTGSAAVPEPGTIMLLGSGLVGAYCFVRRRLM